MTDDTRRHITVSDWAAIGSATIAALDDPRIDRVKLKLRKKVAGLSDEDEQAAIRDGAPCFLSVVVRADPMPDKDIWRVEQVTERATKGPWIEAIETSRDGLFQFSGIYSDTAQHHVATSVNTEGDSAFIADARTSVPSLCRALRQAKAMIPRETYFASLKGAKKWVAYRLRNVTVEGKPLPTVLKYNVSVRTHGDGVVDDIGEDGDE